MSQVHIFEPGAPPGSTNANRLPGALADVEGVCPDHAPP